MALTIAVLRSKWGIPAVLSLLAAYGVVGYALFADNLPGVSASDIFALWGFGLLSPCVAMLVRLSILIKKDRKAEGDDAVGSVRDPKGRMGHLLMFGAIPVAALAAWLCVYAYRRAFPLATHLTEAQLVQLAPIQRKLYAAANENQCEQMLNDRIRRPGSVGIEDALNNLGTRIAANRRTEEVLNTLPQEDIEAYAALRDDASSQKELRLNDPSISEVMDAVAPKLSDAGEKARFKAVSDPLTDKIPAPANFDYLGSFCSAVRTMTRHSAELPPSDVDGLTRFLGF